MAVYDDQSEECSKASEIQIASVCICIRCERDHTTIPVEFLQYAGGSSTQHPHVFLHKAAPPIWQRFMTFEQSMTPVSSHVGTYGGRDDTFPQVALGLEAATLSSMPHSL